MKIKQILLVVLAFLMIFSLNVFGTAQPIGPYYNDLILTYGASGLEVKAPLGAAYGGTGVANNALNTITFTGNYSLGLTLTANSAVTLPTTGTLATTSDKLSVFGATTSAELAGVISDETGTDKLVYNTSPTLVTPLLGTPTSGVLTNCTGVEVVTDTTPELGGDLDCNNKLLTEVNTVQFNGLYAIGNSGSTETVDWDNGQYQSITISEACVISFSNMFTGTITLHITWSATAAMTFDGAYTILEEGGTEIVFSDTDTLVDILKIYYYGAANTYVMGAMIDVKD